MRHSILKTLALTTMMSVAGPTLANAQTHADLEIPRKDARQVIAEALFGGAPTFHDYNDWRNAGSTNCSLSSRGGHPGWDSQTTSKRRGDDFFALDSGIVRKAGGDSINTIAIFNPNTNRTTIYLHAESVDVNIGDTVKKGDYLGGQGDQGSPGAYHVHIEVLAGDHDRATCGADNPGNPDRITVDPVSYLFSRVGASDYNYEEDNNDHLEDMYRIAASKVLPTMIRSSNSRLRCNNAFRVDFEFSSYMRMEDIVVVVELRDRNRKLVVNKVIEDDDLRDNGESGFVVTGGNRLPEKVYRVRADIPLSSSEEDDLGSRTLIRTYVMNKAVQMTLPDFDEITWASAFSLFIPRLLDENFGQGNEAYVRGDQSHAQRYIEVDTSECR